MSSDNTVVVMLSNERIECELLAAGYLPQLGRHDNALTWKGAVLRMPDGSVQAFAGYVTWKPPHMMFNVVRDADWLRKQVEHTEDALTSYKRLLDVVQQKRATQDS